MKKVLAIVIVMIIALSPFAMARHYKDKPIAKPQPIKPQPVPLPKPVPIPPAHNKTKCNITLTPDEAKLVSDIYYNLIKERRYLLSAIQIDKMKLFELRLKLSVVLMEQRKNVSIGVDPEQIREQIKELSDEIDTYYALLTLVNERLTVIRALHYAPGYDVGVVRSGVVDAPSGASANVVVEPPRPPVVDPTIGERDIIDIEKVVLYDSMKLVEASQSDSVRVVAEYVARLSAKALVSLGYEDELVKKASEFNVSRRDALNVVKGCYVPVYKIMPIIPRPLPIVPPILKLRVPPSVARALWSLDARVMAGFGLPLPFFVPT